MLHQPWLDIAKAGGADQAELERISRLVGTLGGRIGAAFLDAVKRLADSIDLRELRRLLEAGRVSEAIAMVSERSAMSAMEPLAREITYSTIFSARQAADAASQQKPLATMNITFDPTETEAVTYLRQNDMNLIRETSADVLATIRQTITDGVTSGRNPLDVARDVRSSIGLTARQNQAVLNYRHALENLDRRALQRALRDKRFDSSVARAIENDRALPKDKIDGMVERYRQRYLKYRSETIARTEGLRAANGGQDLAWRQMVAKGIIPPEAITRKWWHRHDSRVRTSHLLIPAMNPKGVGLDEPFQSIEGPILYPGDPAATAANDA